MLNEQDKLKELFSEKLGSFEAPVNPELWNAIASKIGTASAVTASGLSVLTKTIIGIAAAGVVGVGTYFIVQSSTNEEVRTEGKPISKVETITEKEVIETQPTSTDVVIEKEAQFKEQSTTVSPENRTQEKEVNEASKEIVDVVEYTPIQKKELKEIVPTTTPKEEKKELIIPSTPKKNVTPVKEHKEVATFKEIPVVPSATIKQLSNVFSPDGDGVNDELFIDFTGELLDFSLIVMDEKNQTIYQSRDANFRWNGIMMNGNPAPVGNYYYVITARDLNGLPINKYSRLSIFR